MPVIDIASYIKRKEASQKIKIHNPKGKGVYKVWRYGDLNGLRPKGHPTVFTYGPRGKVLLEIGQVWVEIHNGILWRVNELDTRHDGTYKVTLGLYYHPKRNDRMLAETTLRLNMEIWDVVGQKRSELLTKLKRCINAGEGKAFGITSLDAAARFFGLDPKTGERID